jgi:hypothetical protein
VEYVAPDTVELTGADMELFADREPDRVGSFWATWRLDEDARVLRRDHEEQTGKVLCPGCGVSRHVTNEGRLELHVGRDLPPGADDRRCSGAGLLVRVDVIRREDVVSRRERRRLAREARRAAQRSEEQPGESAEPLDLDELDRPFDGG